MDLIRDEQKKLAVEIADLQKEIDVNPFEKSVALMTKNSNEEMLAKKYDKLFPITPLKKVAQADNKTALNSSTLEKKEVNTKWKITKSYTKKQTFIIL